MCQHLLVTLSRMLRCIDSDDLDLRELVQTVQTTHILTVRTGFATEALSVGTVLDGQILLVDDDIAIDIGNRYLGSRNQIEIIYLAVVHLALLIGQLACAVARILVHNRWRHDLLVAGLASLGEEEVDEGALQTGTQTAVNREAGTGNLYTQIEVDQVQVLGNLPVWQLGIRIVRVDGPVTYLVLAQHTFLEVGLHYPVVLGTGTFRNLVVRNIRDLAEHGINLLLELSLLVVQLLVGALQGSYLSLSLFGLGFLAFFHQGSDALGKLVALGEVIVELLLSGTTLLILGNHGIDGLLSTIEVLLVQTGNYAIVLLGNQFQSKHIFIFLKLGLTIKKGQPTTVCSIVNCP